MDGIPNLDQYFLQNPKIAFRVHNVKSYQLLCELEKFELTSTESELISFQQQTEIPLSISFYSTKLCISVPSSLVYKPLLALKSNFVSLR